MLFICRIQVRRHTLFGGGLMVYFDNELSRRTVDGIPLRCMVIIVRQPSLLKGSNIPRECLDKCKVRIDIRNLRGSLCDIQLLFSDNYYPRGSTEEATNMSIWMIKIIILNMHSRWSVDIVLKHYPRQGIFWHASSARKQGGMC